MIHRVFFFVIIFSAIELFQCERCTLRGPVEKSRSFPESFIWGASSSAYQIEGGWNADGKGESIWDYRTHTFPNQTLDRLNGDVASDSYHKWREDVQIAHELNLKFYRFSISWTRVLPGGFINNVNKPGIDYYNNLIDELLRYNITPLITIYHWDLPQRLQELGGWTNPEIVPIYTDYAKLLFQTFGDRVKNWITINEPWQICENSYGTDVLAPAINMPGIPTYMCAHNILKGHAEVYHLYHDQFKKTQNGEIGISLDARWYPGKTESKEDQEAGERALQFFLGWFAHPVFSKEGDYPKVMRDRIDQLSKEQGFARSRLPKFTDAEIKRIRGTSDFFGLHTYTSSLITPNGPKNPAQYPIPSYLHDSDIIRTQDPSWPSSGRPSFKVHPQGIYYLLKWIDKEYNHPRVLISENGFSDQGGINDFRRIEVIKSYLGYVLDAIEEGVNVGGYWVWSLIDSYSWSSGYTEMFGLYAVDFNDPDRKRTPKESGRWYANICKTGILK